MRAVLKAQINKTDRNDGRGIAQMMRAGLYRPVHVKTLRSQKLRMLLTHRKLLQSKAIAIENDLRATLRNFGLEVGMVGTAKFEARIALAWCQQCSRLVTSCVKSLTKPTRSFAAPLGHNPPQQNGPADRFKKGHQASNPASTRALGAAPSVAFS